MTNINIIVDKMNTIIKQIDSINSTVLMYSDQELNRRNMILLRNLECELKAYYTVLGDSTPSDTLKNLGCIIDDVIRDNGGSSPLVTLLLRSCGYHDGRFTWALTNEDNYIYGSEECYINWNANKVELAHTFYMCEIYVIANGATIIPTENRVKLDTVSPDVLADACGQSRRNIKHGENVKFM